MKPDEKYMNSVLPVCDKDLKFAPLNNTPHVGWNFKDLFDAPQSMRMAPPVNANLNLPNWGSNTSLNEMIIQGEPITQSAEYFRTAYMPSYNKDESLSYESDYTYKENNTPAELLRNLNLEIQDDDYLRINNKDCEMNKIMDEIDKDCPGIISLLEAYNIPSPIAKLIVRRIVKISLKHCKK